MRAGAHRLLITVQQDQPSARVGDGSEARNWVTLGTFWAEKVTLPGTERWQARQVQGVAPFTLRVPYCSALADLSGSVRVVVNGRVAHVKDPSDVNERGRAIELTCEEAPDASQYDLAIADTTGEPLLDPDGHVLQEPY